MAPSLPKGSWELPCWGRATFWFPRCGLFLVKSSCEPLIPGSFGQGIDHGAHKGLPLAARLLESRYRKLERAHETTCGTRWDYTGSTKNVFFEGQHDCHPFPQNASGRETCGDVAGQVWTREAFTERSTTEPTVPFPQPKSINFRLTEAIYRFAEDSQRYHRNWPENPMFHTCSAGRPQRSNESEIVGTCVTGSRRLPFWFHLRSKSTPRVNPVQGDPCSGWLVFLWILIILPPMEADERSVEDESSLFGQAQKIVGQNVGPNKLIF